MAAIADYLDLRTAVIAQVGSDSLVDVFRRLTLMAEGRLNRELRTRQQIATAVLTFAAGVAPLPADFLARLHLYDQFGCELIETSLARVEVEGSQYRHYAIDGSNVRMNGVSGDRDAVYYAALPTITASPAATNWLLAGYPDVYLYAVAFEAAKHLRNVEMAQQLATLADGAINALRIDSDRARYGKAAVRVYGATP